MESKLFFKVLITSVFLFSVMGLVLTGQPSHAQSVYTLNWGDYATTTTNAGFSSNGINYYQATGGLMNVLSIAVPPPASGLGGFIPSGSYSANSVSGFTNYTFLNTGALPYNGTDNNLRFAFVAPLTNLGQAISANPYTLLTSSQGTSVTASVFGSNGDYYVAGGFSNTATGVTNLNFFGTPANNVSGSGAYLQDVHAGWKSTVAITGQLSYFYIDKIAVDATGNVYAAGTFSGTATFSNSILSIVSSGGIGAPNAFLMKYSSTGALIWAEAINGAISMNTNSKANATSIALDPSGNLWFTESLTLTSSGITFPGLSGSISSTTPGPKVIIASVNPINGNFLHVDKVVDGSGTYPAVGAMLVDGSKVYIGGATAIAGSDFDPSAGVANVPNGAFIAAYNYSSTTPSTPLTFAWGMNPIGVPLSGNGMDIESMDFDNYGNILAGGFFQANYASNPIPGLGTSGTGIPATTVGSNDLYLTRVTTSGVLVNLQGFDDGNDGTGLKGYGLIVKSLPSTAGLAVVTEGIAYGPYNDNFTHSVLLAEVSY